MQNSPTKANPGTQPTGSFPHPLVVPCVHENVGVNAYVGFVCTCIQRNHYNPLVLPCVQARVDLNGFVGICLNIIPYPLVLLCVEAYVCVDDYADLFLTCIHGHASNLITRICKFVCVGEYNH